MTLRLIVGDGIDGIDEVRRLSEIGKGKEGGVSGEGHHQQECSKQRGQAGATGRDAQHAKPLWRT